MLCCAAFTPWGVLNSSKKSISCDIDTKMDDQQIMENPNMMKIVDTDPFMHEQTASIPKSCDRQYICSIWLFHLLGDKLNN